MCVNKEYIGRRPRASWYRAPAQQTAIDRQTTAKIAARRYGMEHDVKRRNQLANERVTPKTRRHTARLNHTYVFICRCHMPLGSRTVRQPRSCHSGQYCYKQRMACHGSAMLQSIISGCSAGHSAGTRTDG